VSVSDAVDIQQREFAGYTDPALPEGQWHVFGSVNGDASGGNREIQVVFKRTATPLSSTMWSLDQLSVRDADENTKFLTVEFLNMDPLHVGPIDIGIAYGFACQLVGVAGAFAGARITGRDVSHLPVWLGRALDAVNSALMIITLVNVDVRSIEVAAMGYYWGPRSITAEGGPRRPLGGMFAP